MGNLDPFLRGLFHGSTRAAAKALSQRSETAKQVRQSTVVASRKSPGLAAVLGVCCGPIGVFYVNVGYGILAIVIAIVIVVVTQGVAIAGFPVVWPIMGYMLAKEHNAKLDAQELQPRAAVPPPLYPLPQSLNFCSKCGVAYNGGSFCSACGARY